MESRTSSSSNGDFITLTVSVGHKNFKKYSLFLEINPSAKSAVFHGLQEYYPQTGPGLGNLEHTKVLISLGVVEQAV